jgi:hypothetical protein
MEQYATWLNKLAFACIGCAAIAIGVGLMGGSWSLL